MNKDEIILMADASGLSFYGMGKDRDKFLHYLKAFAALVAEREREACQTCVEIHSLLDADESMIIRNARDGYPEGRTPRELTLLERVKSLCTYAADWKRWCIEAQTPPAPPAAQRPWQGLTDEDWGWVADKKGTSLDTFDQGVAWAQQLLKERNE